MALEALAATLPSHDVEDVERKQAALTRIRNEIMEIAREVAELRHVEVDGFARPIAAPRTAPKHEGRIKRPPVAVREAPPPSPQPYRAHASAAHTRPAQQATHIAAKRNHQPVSSSTSVPPRPPGRAQQNSRAGHAQAAGTAASTQSTPTPRSIGDEVKQFAPVTTKAAPKQSSKQRWSVPQRLRLGFAARAALLAGVMLAGSGLITIALWGKLPWQHHDRPRLSLMFAQANTSHATPEAKAAKPGHVVASSGDQVAAVPPFEMPETYGVYAISDGHLTALEPLPIRVPDARVSISGTITKPAPAPISNGNLQFAVYHRELATNVPDSASVRIVAKVMHASTFVGGKPKSIPVEDAWAVRGGAIDLRIAPVAANKEMIVIRPADPNFTLSPGRYVLMFKNQAYDFSVAGTVADTAHCLERSDLQDRSVYSECREPPAAL